MRPFRSLGTGAVAVALLAAIAACGGAGHPSATAATTPPSNAPTPTSTPPLHVTLPGAPSGLTASHLAVTKGLVGKNEVVAYLRDPTNKVYDADADFTVLSPTGEVLSTSSAAIGQICAGQSEPARDLRRCHVGLTSTW